MCIRDSIQGLYGEVARIGEGEAGIPALRARRLDLQRQSRLLIEENRKITEDMAAHIRELSDKSESDIAQTSQESRQMLDRRADPVSYTHLDVYKRQALFCLDVKAVRGAECTVKVGRVLPMTGALQVASLVHPWIDDFKVGQLSKKGGLVVGGQHCAIEIKYYDSKSTPAGSGEAATKAIVEDKVDVVLSLIHI